MILKRIYVFFSNVVFSFSNQQSSGFCARARIQQVMNGTLQYFNRFDFIHYPETALAVCAAHFLLLLQCPLMHTYRL